MAEVQPWHHLGVEEVLSSLGSRQRGLTLAEVEKQKQLLPRVPKPRATSAWKIILHQFVSPFMGVLAVAVVLSFFTGAAADAALLIFIVLFNVTLGFVQEYRTDRALFALQQLLPRTVTVRRDGMIVTVSGDEIVPGDIMLLTSGDKIVADARLITASVFSTNEAPLTGESSPVEKEVEAVGPDAATAEQTDMVFAGTVAVSGKAEAVVIGVGANTVFGQVTQMVSTVADTETPLTKELRTLSRNLTLAVIGIAAAVFAIGILEGFSVLSMLALAIALAVAAVPEGLTVALTVIFVAGMRRMAKRGTLIRRMVAAETLGSVTVMCMDKTGTLTTGQMTVEHYDGGADGLRALAALVRHEGRATALELAVKRYVSAHPGKGEEIAIVQELPFDSRRKYSAIVGEDGGEQTLFVWGAPDIVFSHLALFADAKEKLIQNHRALMAQGLRVLFLAQRPWKDGEISAEAVTDLLPVGFIGLRDPLRKEAKHVVREAERAGVRTVMITGDHEDTARSIAAELGLAATDASVASRNDFKNLDDRGFAELVKVTSVFARVLPEDKVRILRAFQQAGHVVAMTGDGVNDAPALKAADIGVAMGSGTDAAKEAADVVLLTDDIGSLLAAIREGRVIYDNVRKVTIFLVTFSLSEVAIIAFALLTKIPAPFLPVHLLFLNVITDGFPAMALAFEPGEAGIMNARARKKGETVINKKLVLLMSLIGATAVFFHLILEYVFYEAGAPIAEIRTLLFISLGTDALVAVFVLRHLHSHAFARLKEKNPFFFLALVVSAASIAVPVLVTPLREAFDFVLIAPLLVLFLVVAAAAKFAFFESLKHMVIPESRGIM